LRQVANSRVCLTRHLPLSAFLTPSGVCTFAPCAALFHAATARRISITGAGRIVSRPPPKRGPQHAPDSTVQLFEVAATQAQLPGQRPPVKKTADPSGTPANICHRSGACLLPVSSLAGEPGHGRTRGRGVHSLIVVTTGASKHVWQARHTGHIGDLPKRIHQKRCP
jgi:hypothetical protein